MKNDYQEMYIASMRGIVHSTTTGWTRSDCWSNIIEQPHQKLNLESATGPVTRSLLRNRLYKRGWRVHRANVRIY